MKTEFDKMDAQIVCGIHRLGLKSQKFSAESGLILEVAYGLGIDQAWDLGLYISTPLDGTETDQPFAEPGLFFIRPDSGLHFAEISSIPICLPDLEMLKVGIDTTRTRITHPVVLADLRKSIGR